MNSQGSGQNGERTTNIRTSYAKRKSSRKNKGAGLILLLVFLLGSGGVIWFGMKKAAYNLAGDKNPDRVVDDSSASGIGVARVPSFPDADLEEDAAGSNPSLKSFRPGKFYGRGNSSRGPLGGGGGVSGGEEDGATAGSGGSGDGAGLAAAAPAGGNKGYVAPWDRSSTAKKGVRTGKASDLAAGTGGLASIRAVRSNGASAEAAGKGPRTSVMEALKSAFKANLMGARLASQDAAKTWIAKTFDANRDYSLSVEYTEKMKSQLDRVNPNSMPGYLRQQNLDSASARSLGVPKVQMPYFDRTGTQEALNADKDYQTKKTTQEIITAMFKPMGPFDDGERKKAETDAASALEGARLAAQSMETFSIDSWDEPAAVPAVTPKPSINVQAETPKPSVAAPSTGPKPSAYQLKPEEEQTLKTDAAQELATTPSVDYGAECGCTPKAPCCCLPPGYGTEKEKIGIGNAVLAGADFPPVSISVGAAGVSTSGSIKAGGGGGGGSW